MEECCGNIGDRRSAAPASERTLQAISTKLDGVINVAIVSGDVTISENIASWGGTPTSLGQKLMAASVPVTLASDQSALPVSISGPITIIGPIAVTQSGTWSIGRTWTLNSTSDSVTVTGAVSVSNFPSTFAVNQSGNWSVRLQDGSGNSITSTANALDVNIKSPNPLPISGSVSVSNFPSTQPISGTITASQGTANSIANSWPVEITDGTNILGTPTHPVRTDPTGTTTQPVSGSVSVSNFPATQPVSGTVTVNQGTSPWVVSGTIAATQSGTWNVGRTWNLASGSDNVSVVQGTSPWVVSGTIGISGSVSVTQGTSPWVVSGTVTANQGTANTVANSWPTKITDGTNTVSVKAASTAPTATDPALVVTISPNSILSITDGVAPSQVRTLSLVATAQAIKATTGDLWGWNIINTSLVAVYVKFYNTVAASVTVGTTTVIRVLSVPALTSVLFQSDKQSLQNFSTAMSYACVTGIADNSTVAPSANTIYAEIYYK